MLRGVKNWPIIAAKRTPEEPLKGNPFDVLARVGKVVTLQQLHDFPPRRSLEPNFLVILENAVVFVAFLRLLKERVERVLADLFVEEFLREQILPSTLRA